MVKIRVNAWMDDEDFTDPPTEYIIDTDDILIAQKESDGKQTWVTYYRPEEVVMLLDFPFEAYASITVDPSLNVMGKIIS